MVACGRLIALSVPKLHRRSVYTHNNPQLRLLVISYAPISGSLQASVMLGTSVSNGSTWSKNAHLASWSSLEDSEQRNRGDLLKEWIFGVTRNGHSRPLGNIRRQSPLTTSPSSSTTRFVLLCSLWYTSSAMSSNTGKAILNQFRYPVTLTFIQFGFVAGYCLLFTTPLFRFSRIRSPTRAIIRNTAPMAVFQVGGHIFSSVAIARVPVSTVHTIKVRSCMSQGILSFILIS